MLAPDGKYGSQDITGEWNGMVRQVMIGVRIHLCLTGSMAYYANKSTQSALLGFSENGIQVNVMSTSTHATLESGQVR